MKKILVFSLLLGMTIQAAAAQQRPQLKAEVGERFELTSILFAQAGAQEYSRSGIPSYREDMAKLPQVSEVIEYIKQLRNDRGIAYDAVSTTADWMEIHDGRVRFQPAANLAEIAAKDTRWNEALLREYIEKVDEFYVKTDFHTFYTAHKPLYKQAAERLDELLARVKTQWFEEFFGRPFDPGFCVYASLTNGPSNYMLPDGILVGAGSDRQGTPAFNPQFISVMMHEFSHHYTNPIVERYWPQMEDAALKIFPHVRQQMLAIAYGDARTMTGEWLNELFTYAYLKKYDTAWTNAYIASAQSRGWVWMDQSMALIDRFQASRDRYPTIEAFMPVLVKHLNETSKRIGKIVKEYDAKLPLIVAVKHDADAIAITFSEPMMVGNNGFGYPRTAGLSLPSEGMLTAVDWANDGLSVTLKFNPTHAEKGRYGLSVLAWAFRSQRGYPLKPYPEDIVFEVKQ